MASICKATIIGALGGDPEMRYTPNGTALVSFNVACNRNYTTGEGERKEETEWFGVTAFGKLAETCRDYLQKGSKVYVEGRLSTRTWDSPSGEKRWRMEVTATEVHFLSEPPKTRRPLSSDEVPF